MFWDREDRKPLLVVGIDPGTTVGCAVLSLDGEVLALFSERGLGQDGAVAALHALGRVVILGTDKSAAPSLVQKLAARFGARLVAPNRDLSIEEKRELCGAEGKNPHEMDALASARFSLKSIQQLLRKMERQLSDAHAEEDAYEVAKVMLTTPDVNVKQALEFLHPLERPAPVPHVAEPLAPRAPEPPELARMRRERDALAQQNLTLKKVLSKLRRKSKRVAEALSRREETPERVASQSSQRALENALKQLAVLRKELQERDRALASGMVVLKPLANLSKGEWGVQRRFLRPRKGDIFLVRDPNTASSQVVEELSAVCDTLVYLEPPKSISPELAVRFVLLDGSSLRVQHIGPFALASRDDIDSLRSSRVNVDRLLVEHRERLL